MSQRIRLTELSTYSLKTRFQALLRPVLDTLVHYGVTANQITLVSAALCILYSLLLVMPVTQKLFLLLLPLFLLLRMALNALDGMVASSTNTRSNRGLVYNELGDVVSDLCLFAAFVFMLDQYYMLWILVMVLGLLAEFISVVLVTAKIQRPNQGPFAKSDRAVFLGVFALLLLTTSNDTIIGFYIGLGVVLGLLTVFNRLRTISRI